MAEPKYCDITDGMVPTVVEGDNTIKVISGNYKDKTSSVYGDYVKMTYLDVQMKNNSDWEFSVNTEDTVFIYIVEGEGLFGSLNTKYKSKRAVLFSEGDVFKAKTEDSEIRFFLYAAKPLKEPIAWGGPIVMNTKEELNHAFSELRDGTFIKHK